MSGRGLHIRLKDGSSRTFLLEVDDVEVGEITIDLPSARASTVALCDGRRIELVRGGDDLQGYIANENGQRRAFMLLSNIAHSGKVFTTLGTDYLVDLDEEPYSQMAISRQGDRPGIIIMRSRRNSSERIQSDIRRGDFGREELITLGSLAVSYFLSDIKEPAEGSKSWRH